VASLWERFTAWRRRQAVEREEAEEQMSPSERHYVRESIEEHQADTYAEEHGLEGLPPLDVDDERPR